MHPSTLYKGYQAQLAARETARQRMLATAWEIEETERFIIFLNAIHADNEDRLKLTDDQLHAFRNLFSERDCVDADDDRDYLQAVYEDECEILKIVASQAEHVAKVLGSRVSKAFQHGVGASRSSSLQPGFVGDDSVDKASVESGADGSGSPTAGGVPDDDDNPIYLGTPDNLGIHPKASCVATAIDSTLMSTQHRAPRKGKTTIPKPPRGSGLNPSHAPADTQINIPDEQPRPPEMSNFDPHQRQHAFGTYNQPSPGYSNPGDSSSGAGYTNSLLGAGYTNSLSNAGYTNSLSNAGYTNSLSSAGYTNSLSSAGYTNSLSSAGYTNSLSSAGYTNSLSAAGYSAQSSSQSLSGAQSPRAGPSNINYNVPSLASPPSFHLIGPIPHWLGGDADAARALTHNPILDEIPVSNVIHTLGPVRSIERRRRSRRMPSTPSLAPYSAPPCPTRTPNPSPPPSPTRTPNPGPSSATTSSDVVIQVKVSAADREQVYSRSRDLIKGTIFTPDAIASKSEDQSRLVRDMIKASAPSIPSLRGLNRWPSTPKDVPTIWRGVVLVRSTMMTIARQNVVMAYDLLPEHDSNIPPDQFRVDRVASLVRDKAYMHKHSFSQDGTVIIHNKCQNKFIFTLLIKLIWLSNHGLHALLGNHQSPREALHHAYCLACSITEHALLEQGQLIFTKQKFSPTENKTIFDSVNFFLNSLSEEEKASLDRWKDHLIVCGRSQQGSTAILSDFDLTIET
ncbi:uncharacterized protein F5891DRAFT_984260 [Suillus fuscotomentosus]|uniref:DUF6532 domain-containing protein n=1 Tax=Suillus fuscotomentosus TaxID=1912939 RepID=A0AAD4DWL8_9AGAM|nr:uncharacterized protein F5891DRAFT_984260 [Suillus fuscotomentosus]KAG1895476.1 hypothetical protein F5891DRAFT_984260 [Suillus fuscotomentosus]